jgi:hypothetical protein
MGWSCAMTTEDPPPPAALASEASGQRGNSLEVGAPDTRPEPGSSARPARAGDKLIRDALLEELQRDATDADGTVTTKLQLVARTLVDKSIAGDVAALKELQDRIDGKPPPANAGADKRPERITFQWKDSGSR